MAAPVLCAALSQQLTLPGTLVPSCCFSALQPRSQQLLPAGLLLLRPAGPSSLSPCGGPHMARGDPKGARTPGVATGPNAARGPQSPGPAALPSTHGAGPDRRGRGPAGTRHAAFAQGPATGWPWPLPGGARLGPEPAASLHLAVPVPWARRGQGHLGHRAGASTVSPWKPGWTGAETL